MLVLAISVHDSAQAWAANRLGDPTGKMLGRISMNPARHFDLFGMAIWPLLYIWQTPLVLGWGKPVPMTYRNFPKKNGEMLATLAGPLAQVLTAVVCAVVVIVLKHAVAGAASSVNVATMMAVARIPFPTDALPAVFPFILLLEICVYVNLLLAVFNLVPIPFLDGGKILRHYLPYNAAKAFDQYSLYIMIAFFFVGFRLIMVVFAPLLSVFLGLMNAL